VDESKIKVLKRTHSALVLGVSALVHVPLIVCVALLLVIVVPSFEGMFRTLGAELPGVTQMVLALGMNVRQNWPLWMCLLPVIFILDAAAVAALARYVGGFWAWLYSFVVAVGVSVVGLTIFLSLYVPLFKTATSISS
jgi:type II secretory pathway component PulF